MEKVPVTSSALIQRAKRGYAAEGAMLKISRSGSKVHSLGPFYTVNTGTNVVDSHGLNITDLAKMFLKPHEVLAS